MKIIAGSNNKLLVQQLALALGADYIEPIITYFSDTEVKIEVLEPLHNEDVVILQSTSRPVNNHLVELLLLIDIAKQKAAKQIVVVIPYLGYARQDLISRGVSIPARLIANFLEQSGATAVITVDLHSSKIEKFFKIPIYNLDPINLYLPFLKNYQDFVVVAPDKGSINRAKNLANLLNVETVCLIKTREGNNCQIIDVRDDLKNKNCLLIDDIVDSGVTICESAKFLLKQNALSIDAFITHAVLSLDAKEKISNSPINNMYITDTIKSDYLPSKFHIISIIPIIIESLRKLCLLQPVRLKLI